MPCEKTFFTAVHFNGIIYTFGGYDAYDKIQLPNCEYFDIEKNTWHNAADESAEFKLIESRS